MNTLKKILLLFLSALIFVPAIAQDDPEKEQIKEVVELGQLGLIKENQGGNSNGNTQAGQQYAQQQIRLFEMSTPQTGNNALIIQNGNQNQTNVTQTGDKNGFGIAQNGNNNQYNGQIAGEENLIMVLQNGNNNYVSQDLEGNQMNLNVVQDGNNHQLHQVEKDGTSPSYTVTQTGNSGMEVTIKHQKVW